MAFATVREAFEAGGVIYGHQGRVSVKPVAGGFIYEPLSGNKPVNGASVFDAKNVAVSMDSPITLHKLSIKGLRQLAKSNVSIDEFANAVEAVIASDNSNKVAVASDSAIDSTMEELAGILLENYTKRSRRAIANDDAEQENKQFAGDSDPYTQQYEATKAHYAAIHERQAESARQQTLAARNGFKR